MSLKKSCKYGKYGLFKHLAFLVLLFCCNKVLFLFCGVFFLFFFFLSLFFVALLHKIGCMAGV